MGSREKRPDVSVARVEDEASLQTFMMSKCFDVARTSPTEVVRALGHATRRDYSAARLQYLRSADQYLSYAARILPIPTDPPTATLAQIDTRFNTVEVLRTLHGVIFHDLSEGRGLKDTRYGCNDYHNLLSNIINTFNTHHEIFYPLLEVSPWRLTKGDSDRFDDLRLRLEKEKAKVKAKEEKKKKEKEKREKEKEQKGGKFSSLIGACPRHEDTVTTPDRLKTIMDTYIELCKKS